MLQFNGKVVIVTGGAKGIGRGICLAFAREGARVLCADVDEAAGEQLVERDPSLAGTLRFQPADVAEAGACAALVDAAVSQWGGVDVVCNNVGIQPTSSYLPAHELPEDLWDRILDVNLKSCFLMTRSCVPAMIERGGGVIINTASVQGLQSMKGVCAYAASKGGLLSLTRQLALEYADRNIRVLAVNPGAIETPLLSEAVAHRGMDLEQVKRSIAAGQPIKRVGQPEDVAEAFLYLASEKASFMTGEYVNVDGGAMAQGAWAE